MIQRARDMFHLLERGDVPAATEQFSERIRGYIAEGWSLDEYLRDVWRSGLDDLAGPARRITNEGQISPASVRLSVEGDQGRAFVTISFDDDGGVGGLSIERRAFQGIGTIVIACPDDRREQLAAFYAALLGDDRWRVPRLRFGEAHDYRAPRWGDPQRPQQLHLDILVHNLDAADATATARGATLLRDAGEHRIYADPVGHAFRLSPGALQDSDGAAGALRRVVVDCPDPRALAPFYEALLGMTRRVEDSPQRVVIARPDGGLPMLAFQHVEPYVAPRWPDPAFPQQMHFDLKFDDSRAAQEMAERLGATRLPGGGSCPVYADPAGHPLCLCMHGQ